LFFSEDELCSGISVFGIQTGSFACLGINAIELAAAIVSMNQKESFVPRHCGQPTREVDRVVTVSPTCWRDVPGVDVAHAFNARFDARPGRIPM